MRALPFSVLGPADRPPWNWHFCVLLVFSAGRPHCFLVRVDWAVQRKHRIRPPAVMRDSLIFRIVKLSAFRGPESSPNTCPSCAAAKTIHGFETRNARTERALGMRWLRELEDLGHALVQPHPAARTYW